MDEELILPETDTATPVGDSAPIPTSPSRKTPIFIIIAALVFVSLVISLVIIVTNKSSAPDPVDSPDDSSQNNQPEPSIYYDAEEFAETMDHAASCLADKNYTGTEYYLNLYANPERMTSVQKYRSYSIYADMYSSTHLNNPELAQKYTNLANEALQSIREGEK